MVRIISAGFLTLRLITPWVVRVAGFTLLLFLTAVASLWTGVPNAIEQIADHWVDRAYRAGLPSLYEPYLYQAARAAALLTILAGWVTFAYVTVFLLWIVL